MTGLPGLIKFIGKLFNFEVADAAVGLAWYFKCLYIAWWIFMLTLVLKCLFYLMILCLNANFTTYLIPGP